MTTEPFRRAPAPLGLPQREVLEPALRASFLHNAGVLALTLGLGSCATYRSRPLVPEDELATLRTRTLESLRIEYARPGETREHAAAFDASDGLDDAELVAVALTGNPALRSKRLEIGEAQALLVSAGIWPNPQFDVFARPGIGKSTSTGFGLDLLFALLRPGERAAKRAVAEARLTTTRAEIIAEELRLAWEVRRARIGVLAAEQMVRFFEQEQDLRGQAATLVKQQRELGEATEMDVAVVELDRVAVQRQAREAQTTYERERRTLNRAVGLPPSYELPLAGLGEPLAFTLYDELSDEEVDRRVLAGRFDLHARASSYRRAEEELRLAITRQYPNLRVGPTYETEVEGSEALGLGASIEVPIFDRNQGEIAEKVAVRERARAEYVAALHEARARAFESLAALRRGRAEVELQQRDVAPLITRTETLFEGALRARDLTIFEWITIRGRAVQVRRDLLDALVRYSNTVVELEYATGRPLSTATNDSNEEQGTKRR